MSSGEQGRRPEETWRHYFVCSECGEIAFPVDENFTEHTNVTLDPCPECGYLGPKTRFVIEGYREIGSPKETRIVPGYDTFVIMTARKCTISSGRWWDPRRRTVYEVQHDSTIFLRGSRIWDD